MHQHLRFQAPQLGIEPVLSHILAQHAHRVRDQPFSWVGFTPCFRARRVRIMSVLTIPKVRPLKETQQQQQHTDPIQPNTTPVRIP